MSATFYGVDYEKLACQAWEADPYLGGQQRDRLFGADVVDQAGEHPTGSPPDLTPWWLSNSYREQQTDAGVVRRYTYELVPETEESKAVALMLHTPHLLRNGIQVMQLAAASMHERFAAAVVEDLRVEFPAMEVITMLVPAAHPGRCFPSREAANRTLLVAHTGPPVQFEVNDVAPAFVTLTLWAMRALAGRVSRGLVVGAKTWQQAFGDPSKPIAGYTNLHVKPPELLADETVKDWFHCLTFHHHVRCGGRYEERET